MPRIAHGSIVTTDNVKNAHAQLVAAATAAPLAFAAVSPGDMNAFDFLFPTLQTDDDNLLPEAADTPAKLKALGLTQEDPSGAAGALPDSNVPSIYTYFGQFVDHDITLEVQPADLPPARSGAMPVLLDPNMTPLTVAEIRNVIKNFRSPTLDLDSLYGLPAPRDPDNGDKLLVGTVSPPGPPPNPPFAPIAGKGPANDLPREPRSADILHDRAAMIGDPRNDENLIVAQLHLAFIKAHNALVDLGHNFEEARTILRQHYQYIILHDFLKRVADPGVVDAVIQNGNRLFDGFADPFFMPLEFSVASYRFGHTMARDDYNFNSNFTTGGAGGQANLNLLFTFTALSGQLGFPPGVPAGGTDTLPFNWVIEWENFVASGDGRPINMARRLDSKLAGKPNSAPNVDDGQGLFRLHALDGKAEQPPDAARLAVRNLLRGYRLRLPTGQAIANHLGLPVLSAADILAEAANPAQQAALQAGGFQDRTPLWYYVLAEAGALGNGNHLGPLGSTIVAEVLVGLIRRTEGSILRQPGWQPSLPSAVPGDFQLGDLLRFAGVLAGGVPARTYVVQAGDTLSSIAQNQLGDAHRWPEIFLLNRGIIRNPDAIFPGQVLTLPSGPAILPEPRIYVVKAGDTLSSIAQSQLGDASRFNEIAALNSGVITNPNVIFPNQVLVLPS